MKKLLFILSILLCNFQMFGQTFGNAIDLDGMDDYAVVQHHPSLNPTDGSWSVAFWLNATNKDQVAPVVMKRLAEPPYTQYSYAFGKDDPHDPEPGKKIRINHIEDAGVAERSGYSTDTYIDGYWHHYVIVADKQQDGIIVFVDGNQIDFFPMYYFGLWPDVATTTDLIIAMGSSGDKIEGPLDELSIWNKALNFNHVQQMMYDTLSSDYYSTADSGLVAYYRFDAFEDLGAGNAGTDDFRDFSFYGNHADSEGNPSLVPSGIFVGLEEKSLSNNIKLFPNPARDMISLHFSDLDQQSVVVEIFDLNGRKLIEKQIPAGSEMIEVDVSSLQSGVYFCKMITKQGSTSKKLIVQ